MIRLIKTPHPSQPLLSTQTNRRYSNAKGDIKNSFYKPTKDKVTLDFSNLDLGSKRTEQQGGGAGEQDLKKNYGEIPNFEKNYFSDRRLSDEGIPLNIPDLRPHNYRNRYTNPEVGLPTRVIRALRRLPDWKTFSEAIEDSETVKILPGNRQKHVYVAPAEGMTVQSFLKDIGRGCEQYHELFESWDEFVMARRRDFKRKEIPIVDRKYIQVCLEKYRQGWTPKYLKLKSQRPINKNVEWRTKLYTQRELKEKYE